MGLDNERFIETLKVVGKLEDFDEYKVKEICDSDINLFNLWNQLNKIKKIYLGDKDTESMDTNEFVNFTYNTFVFPFKNFGKKLEVSRILEYLERHARYDRTKDIRIFYEYLDDFNELASTSRNENFFKIREVIKTTDMEICGKEYRFEAYIRNKQALLHDKMSNLICGCLTVKDDKIKVIKIGDRKDSFKVFDEVLYGDFDYMVIPSFKLQDSYARLEYETRGTKNSDYLEYLAAFVIERENVDLDRYWELYDCDLDLRNILKYTVFKNKLDLNLGLDLIWSIVNKRGIEERLSEVEDFFRIMKDMLSFRNVDNFVRELTYKITNIKDIDNVMNRLKYINKVDVDNVHLKSQLERYTISVKGEICRHRNSSILDRFDNDEKIGIYKNGTIRVLNKDMSGKDCVMVLR